MCFRTLDEWIYTQICCLKRRHTLAHNYAIPTQTIPMFDSLWTSPRTTVATTSEVEMYNQMLKEMGQLVTISLPSSTCLRLLYRRNLRRPTLGTSLPLTCCTSPTAPYLTLSLLFPIRHPLRSIASFTRALHQASSHYLDSVFTCIDSVFTCIDLYSLALVFTSRAANGARAGSGLAYLQSHYPARRRWSAPSGQGMHED